MRMFNIKNPGYRFPRWVPWSLLLALGALVAWGIGGRAHQATPLEPPRVVRVVRVGSEARVASAAFAGEVTARHETGFSFRVAGKLVARYVEVGDRVEQGQRLAQLDPVDYRLAVQGLEAQLAAARNERDFLKDDLVRYRELLAQQLISPPEFDRHRTQYRTALEKTAALQAQLDQAKHQLDYTSLRADQPGVITTLRAEAGQVVGVGQTIGSLAQFEEKEISIQIPEHRIGAVRVDQTVQASLWSDGSRRLRGRVREVAPAADPASRTYAVKVSLLEGLDQARLGMTATVWFAAEPTDNLAIPLSAVFTPHGDPTQTRVWRVDERANTVASVPVRIGAAVGKDQVTVAGIGAGELIVSAGAHRLLEGQSIRLATDASAVAKRGELASRGGRP